MKLCDFWILYYVAAYRYLETIRHFEIFFYFPNGTLKWTAEFTLYRLLNPFLFSKNSCRTLYWTYFLNTSFLPIKLINFVIKFFIKMAIWKPLEKLINLNINYARAIKKFFINFAQTSFLRSYAKENRGATH